MTVVVDASTIVAWLTDAGARGAWAAGHLNAGDLAAPHIMPAEAASVLRRMVHADRLSSGLATLAHADLVRLRAHLYPYEPLSDRIWELRPNVTPYDAWYVALAETLGAPLVTMDGRLQRAVGPRCDFEVFPDPA